MLLVLDLHDLHLQALQVMEELIRYPSSSGLMLLIVVLRGQLLRGVHGSKLLEWYTTDRQRMGQSVGSGMWRRHVLSDWNDR